MPAKRQHVPMIPESSKRRRTEEDGGEQGIVRDHTPIIGAEAEVGVIERVTLRNFLCHKSLDLNFRHQITFITGNNSSGKSAVLTAIMVGLGGKASVTNRGTSVKGFIKDGCSTAVVTVTLKNQGVDAFKPRIYGQSITIERRLSKDGGTSYKIKSSDGKIVSTKREEVNHVVDAFNIQVDNPVSVLNQTMAQTFLQSTDDGDKYKFFLKATHLEQLKMDYIMANGSQEIAKNLLHQKKKMMPVLEEEVEDLYQKYKALSAINGLSDKVDRLKNELAWSFIVKRETEVEDKMKELNTQEARLPKYIRAVEKHENELKECKKEHTRLHNQIQECSKEALDLEPKHREARRALNEIRAALRKAQTEERKVVQQHGEKSLEHKLILDRIEKIKNDGQHDYESERVAQEKRIAELEKLTCELEASQEAIEQELEQFAAVAKTYKDSKQNLSREEDEVNHKRRDYQQKLSDHQKARKDRMNCFGAWVPKALAGIEAHFKKGLFHKKPYGPLGSYVELKDQKWAVGVEACLSFTLRAFYVHDHHDEQQLQQVIKKCCPGVMVTIITSPYQDTLFDVSKYRARSTYPAVIDVINVKVPAVMNCLIDQRNIENIILIADNEEARRVMLYTPPQKVREAFTLNGDHLHPAPMFRYYSNNKDNHHAQMLSTSVETNIKYAQQKLAECDNRKQHLQVQQRDLAAQVTKNQQQTKNCKTRLNHLRDQMSKHHLELRELKDQDDPAPPDVTTLEEEAQEIVDQLRVLEENKEAAESLLCQHKADLKTKEVDCDTLANRLDAIANSTEPFKCHRRQLEDTIVDIERHVTHYKQKKSDHEAKIAGFRRQCDELQAELDEDLAKAERYCKRIKTRRTPDSITDEILTIQQQIADHEKEKGNHQETMRKYHELRTTYKKILNEVHQLENFLKALAGVMEQRQARYCMFRSQLAARVHTYFNRMLKQRHYSGKITYDHRAEKLTMKVAASTKNGEGVKDLKSLSGGERSITTVSFIVSFWDAMESPFRCLDEFDVFMDMVNRHVFIDLMLKVAKHQKDRQFIFITPLQLTNGVLGPSVGVVKLEDAKRGQNGDNEEAERTQ